MYVCLYVCLYVCMYVCVCGKSTNKPTTLEWFTAPIYGNCGDGLRRHWGEATDNNMLKFKFKVQLARGGDMGRHGATIVVVSCDWFEVG